MDSGGDSSGDDLLRDENSIAGDISGGDIADMFSGGAGDGFFLVNGGNGRGGVDGRGSRVGDSGCDKMSPMSDTTNLAPAAAGTDIFSHIRHMVYTTGPSYLIALILYGVLGWQFRGDVMDTSNIETMLSALGENFRIHPIQLLPPLLVIVMVVKKIPPLPALLGGMIIGGVFAMTFQSRSIGEVLQAAHNGFVFSDQVAIEATQVKELLERGGLMSMMDTVALTMCALSFGGIMERTKMLEILALALLKRVRSRGSLVLTTILSCIGMNTITADQYLSIIITGRMYKNAYEGRNLHPKNLSRALEDSATLTSPLIPWNACGAYMGGVLGVGAWVYLPYAFFNLLSPVVSVIYGYTGFTMEKITPDKVSNSQNNRS